MRKRIDQYRDAVVIGLGASGRAAAALLRSLGMRVRAYDRNELAEPVPDVELHLGGVVPDGAALRGAELVVLSPGVPPGPIREAVEHSAPGAEITGELALALAGWGALLGRRPPTVLITGTNGKSTVTALTGALLEAGGRRPFVGGNLGSPLSLHLREVYQGRVSEPDALVLECSSFQLETLPATPTQVAMVLNITPDHLDRYPDMDTYAHTKGRIFAGLVDDGLALLHADDAWTAKLRAKIPGRMLRLVGRDLRIEDEDGDAWLVVGGDRWPRDALGIPGLHNASNALFALATARHLGVDVAACERGLRAFSGLPHRMRVVGERDGIVFYNDSKATNVASAVASLGGLERRFVVIAGGKAKGDDFAPLIEIIRTRGRGVVTVGEAGPQIAALARGVVPTRAAETLGEAVALASELAESGDAVVLAPACASYDQFRNYGERGEAFEAAVQGWLSR